MKVSGSKRFAFFSSIFAVLFTILIFGGEAASQNANAEYREWQNAQRKAERKREQYLRKRTVQNHREWQNAVRDAQEEHNEYVRFYSVNDRRNDDRFDNNMNRRYRLYRNGSYYYVNDRGANLLRQAVRSGYERGYQQGQIDRRYGRRYNYADETMYRSATFGWQSIVDQGQYRYYFQEGFERGYEDGFYTTTRYGTRAGTGFSILGSVLETILQLSDDPRR